MEEKNIENLDSPNEELDEQEELETGEVDETDPTALKGKLDKVQEQNKQLFNRAKSAEGFIKGEDGKWVKKPIESKPEPKPKEVPKEDIDKLLDEKLDKRELASLELSDKLKQEVASYAKLKGIPVKQALNSDYIKFVKEQEESETKAEEASLGGGKRRGIAKKDWSQETPTFDLRTEQGKKDKAEYDEYLRKTLG